MAGSVGTAACGDQALTVPSEEAETRAGAEEQAQQEGAGEVLGHSVGVLVHLKEEHQLQPVMDRLRHHHIPVGHNTEHTVAVAVFAIL